MIELLNWIDTHSETSIWIGAFIVCVIMAIGDAVEGFVKARRDRK